MRITRQLENGMYFAHLLCGASLTENKTEKCAIYYIVSDAYDLQCNNYNRVRMADENMVSTP